MPHASIRHDLRARLVAELKGLLASIGQRDFSAFRQRLNEHFSDVELSVLDIKSRKLAERLNAFLNEQNREHCTVAQAALEAIIEYPDEFASSRIVGDILQQLAGHTADNCPNGCSRYAHHVEHVLDELRPMPILV